MLIIHFHEAAGFTGWRWMMLLEGLPAVLLGVIGCFVDRPAEVK